MFEKEAEEYAIGLTYPKFQDNQIANIVLRDVEGGFQKGAEFGYNKGKNEAKEIIKLLLHALENEGSDYTFALENTHPVLAKAKQFVKDN